MTREGGQGGVEAARPRWDEANQAFLCAALEDVAAALARHAGRAEPEPEPAAPAWVEIDEEPPALLRVASAFGLSAFEQATLLLCAGMELDGRFPGLCAAAQGDPSRPFPTFGLALAALRDAHWSALSPAAPLRRFRLIELADADALVRSPLRIDERVLHMLAGVGHLDERLARLLRGVEAPAELSPSHARLAEEISATLRAGLAGGAGLRLVELSGDAADAGAVAAAVGAAIGAPVLRLRAADVPSSARDREELTVLWAREAALGGCALLLSWSGDEPPGHAAAVEALLDDAPGLIFVAGREPLRARGRAVARFDVAPPSAPELRAEWERILGGIPEGVDADALAAQFRLSPPAMRAAAAQARAQDDGSQALWDACRRQARPALEGLAQRIEPAAGWDDLVLPEPQRQALREVVAHVRRRYTVYERWGFAARGERGLGVTALFSGDSGTGKTMAAEVMARELRLDLYRIDLSAVVSKYIGETEKNLRRVFDAAEVGGAILLFDEADALFGKRSEVRDSHDRYANLEVSYLLQRMEAYRGLAILTTNLRGALDTAFMRRLRFVVQFPFPDAAHRAAIWRRAFPATTPIEGLSVERLAQLGVAGGNIRNIALGAAFLAAEAGEPVRMRHLLTAARGECAKLERPLSEAETRGWV